MNSTNKNRLDDYHIENTEAFKEVRIGEFDQTWANFIFDKRMSHSLEEVYKDFNYYTDGEYNYLDRLPVEVIDKNKEDCVVQYKYNKDWFRSDTFKKDHDGLHVLFAGCSNTEGVGLNIEDTWSNLVYQELSKDYKLSGYFNIGKGGYGWEKIMSAFSNYVEKFSAPDILIVNHPNLLRNYYWIPSIEKWVYVQKLPYHKDYDINNSPSNKTEEDALYEEIGFNRIATIQQARDILPNWASAWNIFLKYCESIGTKVVWTCWDYQEIYNIESLGLFSDTFFALHPPHPKWIEEKRPNLSVGPFDMNARDGHPGYLIHLRWKEQFIEAINRRGIINEVYQKHNQKA